MSNPTIPNLIYLDDIAVGDRFVSRSYLLDEESLLAFARQYDPQPFHLDAIKAQHTLFKGLAASGWQTAAITMRLWTETVPIANGLIGIESQVKWPAPTRAGDTLQVDIEVTDIARSKSKPNMGIVTYHSLTKNQHGQVVQDSITKIVVFKRESPAT